MYAIICLLKLLAVNSSTIPQNASEASHIVPQNASEASHIVPQNASEASHIVPQNTSEASYITPQNTSEVPRTHPQSVPFLDTNFITRPVSNVAEESSSSEKNTLNSIEPEKREEDLTAEAERRIAELNFKIALLESKVETLSDTSEPLSTTCCWDCTNSTLPHCNILSQSYCRFNCTNCCSTCSEGCTESCNQSVLHTCLTTCTPPDCCKCCCCEEEEEYHDYEYDEYATVPVYILFGMLLLFIVYEMIVATRQHRAFNCQCF